MLTTLYSGVGFASTASLKAGWECPRGIVKSTLTAQDVGNPPTPSPKKAFSLSGYFDPAVSSLPLAASNVPRKRRLGQPGENPDGVAKADRAISNGLKLPVAPKARLAGSKGYTSWLRGTEGGCQTNLSYRTGKASAFTKETGVKDKKEESLI